MIPLLKPFLNCKYNGKYYQMTYKEYVKFRLGISKIYWHFLKPCMVANSRRMFIGKNSFVGRTFNYFNCADGFYIGNYVRITPNVMILSSNHILYGHQ